MFNSKMSSMNMTYAVSTGSSSACAHSACRNIVNILDTIFVVSIIIFVLVCPAALAISLLVLISLALLGILLVRKNSKTPEANTCS